MSKDQILIAYASSATVIKLVGDVRLTLCVSFDQFINKMFASDNPSPVIFDLREAESIDSTTLGLMAKISLKIQSIQQDNPVLVTSDPSMIRLLHSMGFEDIVDILNEHETPLNLSDSHSLDKVDADESVVKQHVLEAHQILMSLNTANKLAFQELVETLENDYEKKCS